MAEEDKNLETPIISKIEMGKDKDKPFLVLYADAIHPHKADFLKKMLGNDIKIDKNLSIEHRISGFNPVMEFLSEAKDTGYDASVNPSSQEIHPLMSEKMIEDAMHKLFALHAPEKERRKRAKAFEGKTESYSKASSNYMQIERARKARKASKIDLKKTLEKLLEVKTYSTIIDQTAIEEESRNYKMKHLHDWPFIALTKLEMIKGRVIKATFTIPDCSKLEEEFLIKLLKNNKINSDPKRVIDILGQNKAVEFSITGKKNIEKFADKAVSPEGYYEWPGTRAMGGMPEHRQVMNVSMLVELKKSLIELSAPNEGKVLDK